MPTLDLSLSATPVAPPLAPLPAPATAPADPLANLRDIHLPTDVSALPALGWWLLGGLVLVIAISAARIYWKRHQTRRYRRQAQQLLKQITAAEKTPRQQLQQLTNLLKRIALHAYPDHSIAGLNGSDWTEFLHQTAPHLSALNTVKPLLEQAIYDTREISPTDIERLMSFAEQWIQQHTALAPAAELQPDTRAEVADAHV